jgi:tetratricopeptide (TPR) repeat protein
MDLPWSERLAQANQHVGHALALDSRLSEAHQARGAIYRNDLRLTEAEASFRRALAMDPMNVFAREVLVRVYVMMGRPDDALREALLAVQQDPRRPSAHAELGHALVANGRCDDAHAALRRTNALSGDPPLLRVDVYEAECLAMTGRWNDAIRILRPRAAPGDRGALSLLGYVLAGADSTAEAEKILDLLRAQAREHEGWSFSVAEVFAGLSRFDSAFTWLHRAIDERSIVPRVMHPMHRALRADPRFAEIQAKLLRQNR